MRDVFTEQRQAQLKRWADWIDSHEERLERAKEQLGTRYLLHPANRVQRLAKPYGSIK